MGFEGLRRLVGILFKNPIAMDAKIFLLSYDIFQESSNPFLLDVVTILQNPTMRIPNISRVFLRANWSRIPETLSSK